VADEVTFTGESGKTWRYWEARPLGKPGAFGGVYAGEAEDGSPMAIKVVRKDRPQGALDERLLRREIDIGKRAAEIGSSMLLPVIDAADVGDALLLVMHQADGALSDVPAPMGEAEVVPVLADIAAGLQDLHSAGIIHRDLKPANVLRHDGRWKLADFGIARDEEIGTQDPTFMGGGTPYYMAPELWEPKRPTVKTDLYALGCLAYQLLAGAPPYPGNELATIRARHLTQAPPQAPCSDAVLRNLIGRLLAKQPGSRPQDARAVLERLRQTLASRTAVQDAIARGLGAHAAEQAQTAAKESAARDAEAARRELVAQAKADLREIIEDALADLRDVEPDAEFGEHDDERGWTDPSFTLTAGLVGLRVDLWAGRKTGRLAEPVQDDTMILAGCVMITNPRHPVPLNSANLVYEQVGDRLAWQIYKFSGGGNPDRYRYGPYGRTHGLSERMFFDPRERAQMIHPAMFHPWPKTVTPLTADTLLGLFREAVELQPPAPRPGIY
jgi:tRNA A-37 threonylcarbamoyl transferase component Bud32